jgi:exopolysaccharide production protein ExoZ
LRGIAAGNVVVYHATLGARSLGNYNFPIFEIGSAGVDLFFALSGFIMFYISAKGTQAPLKFFKSRARRIIPLYWIATFSMFLMPLASKTIGWSSDLDPEHLTASLFFIGGYHAQGLDVYYPILRPGWTINYEMFFYLIFGTLLAVRNVRLSAALTSLIIIWLIIIGLLTSSSDRILAFYTRPIMIEFVYGMLIASVVLRGVVLSKCWAMPIILVATAVLALDTLLLPFHNSQRALVWGLPTALIIFALVSFEVQSCVRWPRFLIITGDVSYSIYLSHLFSGGGVMIVWMRLPVLRESAWSFVIVTSVVSVVAGIGCYYFVERPLLRAFGSRTKTPHQVECTSKPTEL